MLWVVRKIQSQKRNEILQSYSIIGAQLEISKSQKEIKISTRREEKKLSQKEIQKYCKG